MNISSNGTTFTQRIMLDFRTRSQNGCVCFSCKKYACRDRRSTAARSRHGSDNRIGLSFTTVSPLCYLDCPKKRKDESHSGAGRDGEGGIAQIRGCVDSRGLSLQKYKQKPFAYFSTLAKFVEVCYTYDINKIELMEVL